MKPGELANCGSVDCDCAVGGVLGRINGDGDRCAAGGVRGHLQTGAGDDPTFGDCGRLPTQGGSREGDLRSTARKSERSKRGNEFAYSWSSSLSGACLRQVATGSMVGLASAMDWVPLGAAPVPASESPCGAHDVKIAFPDVVELSVSEPALSFLCTLALLVAKFPKQVLRCARGGVPLRWTINLRSRGVPGAGSSKDKAWTRRSWFCLCTWRIAN